MKQKAMWKKLIGYIAIVMIITLAGTGTVFAASTATDTKNAAGADEAAPQIPAVLGDDLLSEEDAGEGDAPAPNTDDADLTGRPSLGVTVANMNTASYAVVKGILPVGAYITKVDIDSLAAQAGLLAGDIVVEVDETAITTVAQTVEILQAKEADDTVLLKVFRVEGLESAKSYSDIGEGEYLEISIVLTLPEDAVK